MTPVLAHVVRSGFVESAHRGAVVVLDATGRVVAAAGDADAPVFPRSSNKPLQAVGMLRAGLDLPPDDLAIACASHWGEPMHLDRVRSILARAGVGESALRCPPDLPLHDTARADLLRAGGTATPIHMNCSGKHAAMLATCALHGWPADDYRHPGHPLQRAITATFADLTGAPPPAIGVDGCGAPVLATSLTSLARAFQHLVDAPDGPSRRVADAMRAHPTLTSGTGTDDAWLMAAVPGLLSKGGAEGVWAFAVPGTGAVAFKIEDGAMRPRRVIAAAALRRLGIEVDGTTVVLGGGHPVGEVVPAW
ncbi:asparaginase [Spirilliplanes yamanashiensis]|uniref:Asparaginase n=1 Tax=Spirilliplanes yamanashiensis TaxID=42233 RepID=A0A8J3Y5Z7_9ACTN|nr:asparaginase [Spirilliplanes yamanashiensis]MDP9814440.1 L-asparaginase II [Spirilliplanes yamanashiensis]GIJ02092.1 asparaginase [Spirilliplanes yamanashiensis]